MMRDRERTRERDNYARLIEYCKEERERSFTGRIVVRGKESPWEQNSQALVRYYLWPARYWGEARDTPLDDWTVFINDIKKHSGKHRHQGGLVIYVLEGEGYSVVEGERHDWEAGDLLLLPLKTGGVEHQHFNRYENKPAKWIAFINASLMHWGATEMVQVERHPEADRKAAQNGRTKR